MTGDEALTESVRVRMTASEKAALEKAAAAVDRKPAALARQAIRREVERVFKGSTREA